VFSVTIALILIEILTMEFRKIPFTCSYPPGKANVILLWGGYWGSFFVFAFSMAKLEAWMWKRPVRLIPFYLLVAAIFSFFEWWRHRLDRTGVALIFDDAADPAVLTLGLGELAWTKTATTREDRAVRKQPSSSRVSPSR
jgi:hypothetical protein